MIDDIPLAKQIMQSQKGLVSSAKGILNTQKGMATNLKSGVMAGVKNTNILGTGMVKAPPINPNDFLGTWGLGYVDVPFIPETNKQPVVL